MHLLFFFFSIFVTSIYATTENLSIEKKIEFYFEHQKYKTPTTLCRIMHTLGSDKGGGGTHNYTTLYSLLFEKIRNEPIYIFEMGIGTNYLDVPSSMGIHGKPGASLRGWTQYFPNAYVYGADVDSRILFQEENISTFYCDQTKESSIHELFANQLQGMEFDIMIDDGLHAFEANYTLLRNSIKYLRKNGFYIIEDLPPYAAQKFQDILEYLKHDLKLSFIQVLDIPPNASHSMDNKLVVIQK